MNKNNFKIIPISQELAKKMFDDESCHIRYVTGPNPEFCHFSLTTMPKSQITRNKFIRYPMINYKPLKSDDLLGNTSIIINKLKFEPYKNIFVFPPEIKNKPDISIVLVAFSKNETPLFSELVGKRDIDEIISGLFENKSEIEFILALEAMFLGYICRIERK